jgi:predicted RNase H-like HicB family nuclease
MPSTVETTMENSPVAVTRPATAEEKIETVYYCECCGAPRIYTPRIVCEECGIQLPVRAYAFQRGTRFYAECLTFNLISRGDTQEEAIRRLQIAMFSYVKTILQDRAKSTKGLIPRPAPLSSWVRYLFFRLKAYFATLFGRPYPLALRTNMKARSDDFKIAHCH